MKPRNIPNHPLNQFVDKDMQTVNRHLDVSPARHKENSPNLLRNSDNSLSFSITHKDSGTKQLPELESSSKLQGMGKVTQSVKYGTVLSEQLMHLQSKLTNLEEKFLNMNTPEKQGKRTAKSGQLKKNTVANAKSFIQPSKKQNENTVKRRDGVTGKIQSTTRFSMLEKKSSEMKWQRQSALSKQSKLMEQASFDSIRSVQRSKDNQIRKLKREVSRCQNSCQSSRVKKQKVERQLVSLKHRLGELRQFEHKQKQMALENQKLSKALQKSESIRQKQKRLLTEYKMEIKSLKQMLNKRKF